MSEKVTLSQVITFTRDGEWGNGEPTDGFSPALVIRGTDFESVRGGDLSGLPMRYIRSDILERKAVQPGDTLIETAGGTKDQPTGRTVHIGDNVVERASLPLVCASFARFLRPDATKVDPQFLFWKLQDEYHSLRMLPYHIQHTGVARFQYTQFAETYALRLPSLPEQRAVAATLGALDDKIESNRRMNETLEATARAIFKDWFVDFGPTRAKMEDRTPYLTADIWPLFPDALDEDGKPEGWVNGRLGDVARQVGESVSPEALDPNTPYIGLEHMPRRSIALTAWEGAGKVTSGKLAFRKGDFLFGKLRPYFHKVGIAPVDGICSTDIVVLNAHERKAAAFVLACISQDEFVAFTDRTSDGTKMPRTSWGRMARYGLCLPSGSALEAFNAWLEPMVDRIVSNIHESRTLAATRDLLLPRLMSGEVRVEDAEKLAGEAT
jgi:type I restriction enzyme, S subunit